MATDTSCRIVVAWRDGSYELFTCATRFNETEVMEYWRNQSGVLAVTLAQNYHMTMIPNDTYFNSQKKYIEQIKLSQVWEKQTPLDRRPVIAVLDSGVDIVNPDLKDNIWFNPWEVPRDGVDNDLNGYIDDQYGWDFINDTPDPRPKYEPRWNEIAMHHGTIVAGVVAAQGNNALGVAGVAWRARIMPVRVLNAEGIGDTFTVARGIDYAVQNHADIINLSFVGSVSDPVLEVAIQRAYQAGVLVVAAAGNEQRIGVDMNKQPQYPVCDDGGRGDNMVIGVAAVDDYDTRAVFSNYGSKCIDISAPGSGIFSTQFVDPSRAEFRQLYGGYWSGTSVAAPLVSGALALLKSSYPRLSPSELRDVLLASGDDISKANPLIPQEIGRRLNVHNALELAGSARFPRKSPIVVVPQSKALAQVNVVDYFGESLRTFLAYAPNFKDGVNIATGDIDDDGRTDIITVPQARGAPHVRIFNQRDEVIGQFMAFADSFRGGLTVSVGDVTGDGRDDIVIGTGKGIMSMVRVFDLTGNIISQFVPYDPTYYGGINVAVGDVDSDGKAEIIVTPQSAVSLPLRILTMWGSRRIEFNPLPKSVRTGVHVAVGDVNGDGKLNIITAPERGSTPLVRIWSVSGKLDSEFVAYHPKFRGGVNIAVGDVDGDSTDDIVTGAGNGGGPHVRVFLKTGEVQSEFFVMDSTFRGGISVAIVR